MMKTRLFAVAATATAAALAGATPAAADPSHAEEITLTCDALGEIDIVSPGNGMWTPGIVRDGTRVLVPYSFDIVGTFTPNGGGDPDTFEDHVAKPAPRSGRLDSCTFSESDSDENGSFTIEGTVGVSYTP